MPQDPAPGQPSGHVSLNQVETLFGLLLPLPPLWLAGVGLAAVLSLFQVTHTAEGHIVVVMQVSTITAVFVALAWLPALLKVFALTGFDVKTAVGEASTNGLGDLLPLLDPGARRAALPPMIAALEVSAPSMGRAEQAKAQQIHHELADQLATVSAAPTDLAQLEPELDACAKQYEALRASLPSGNERTTRMSAIVTRIVAAARDAHVTAEQVRQMFQNDTEGRRIVAISLLRAHPDPAAFDVVLPAITQPKSAFEQYHALRAAEAMLPALNADRKRDLAQGLRDQRNGQPGAWITPADTSRWELSERLLRAIATKRPGPLGRLVTLART